MANEQLEIPVPIERHDGDRYAEKLIEFKQHTLEHREKNNIFFCFCGHPLSRRYFVSYYTPKWSLEKNYKTVKILDYEVN